MESELVNPLNKQLRRMKRRGSHNLEHRAKTAKHMLHQVADHQLGNLVVKLQEKTLSVGSPR